jgi:glutathione S-transferase
MLTIWGRLNSHNVKKVVWAASRPPAMGAPRYRRPVRLHAGISGDEPQPAGPHDQDGDLTLWESNAILRYIADQHARHLWSGTAGPRPDRPLDGLAIPVADAQREAFLQLVRVPEAERDAAKIEKARRPPAR